MNKKPEVAPKKANKGTHFAEAVFFGLFVFAGYIGAASISKPDLFTDQVKHVVSIVLASFATLIFGYILYRAFSEK